MCVKKMICLALCVVFTLGMWYVPTGLAQETQDRADVELQLLRKLGVINSDFEPDFTITRAQMCDLIVSCLYPGMDLSGGNDGPVFDDVIAETAFYGAIKTCKELKIISGSEDNLFYPNRRITGQEAAAMLLNAMNYGAYANAKGGYPSGYTAVAYEIDLFKGVDLSQDFTGRVIAKMLYNALFADLVEVSSVTDSEITLDILPDKNLLSERLGIEEYDARVMDNGITSLTGDSVNDRERVVLRVTKTEEKITAYSKDSGIENYLGSRLRVFVKYDKQSGRNEVLSFSLHRQCTETLVNADRIINVTSSYIEFEQEIDSQRYQKIALNKTGAAVVINGIHKIDYTETDLKPDDGIMRTVDCDGNGQADFIEVVNFNIGENGQKVPQRNLVASNINAEDGYIGCKFNPAMGLTIDENKADYKIIRSGEIKTLSDLKENDIVSVAKAPKQIDGKDFYFLMVARENFSGSVEAVEETAKRLVIKNKRIEVSDSILSVKSSFLKNIAFGEEADFYLDCTGKVAYMAGASTRGKEYAYLIGVSKDGALDPLNGKFFMKSGEVRTLEFREKVKVDGVTMTDTDGIAASLKKRDSVSQPIAGSPVNEFENNYSRPVILKLDASQKITAIDTDNPNTAGAADDNYYTSEHFLRYSNEEVEDAAALKAGYRSPRNTEYLSRYTYSMSGRYFVTDDTIIMNVPDIDTYGLDMYIGKYATNKTNANINQPYSYDMLKLYEKPKEDASYQILNQSSLSYLYSYDIQAYDIDPDTGAAGLVVLRGRADTFTYGRNYIANDLGMSIYLKTAEAFDETKGKIVKKIYYTTNGSDEQSATVDMDNVLFSYQYLIEGCKAEDTPYGKAVVPLAKGDIIRIAKNGSELAHLERVFRIGEIKTSYSAGLFPSNPQFMYSTNLAGIVTMPNDQRGYYNGMISQYTLTVSYPKTLNGGTLYNCLGKNYISDVNLSDPTSYIIHTSDISSAPVIVISPDPSTGEWKAKNGSISDIKTIDETEGRNLEKASIVIAHHYEQKCSQLIVINR